ncbi:Stf0 family sulfotransferase [Silicimonas algicola]|uniref:Stf0 family sulfotransferase n=1 Tax=Silicimonas algicola TaxID=1826607 RepID=UPI0013DF104D|nr:Stf0 family sulfotransferase [Silicimonas algicola]
MDYQNTNVDTLISKIISMASTPNDIFLLKVFPYQLLDFFQFYKVDPLRRIASYNDVQFIRLERRDRLAQAISYTKASQAKAWTSSEGRRGPLEYSFESICRFYFLIERSYSFWRSYTALNGMPTKTFIYEDLLPDGNDFVQALANHAEVSEYQGTSSALQVQRDSVSEEWRSRFLDEIGDREPLDFVSPSRPSHLRVSNFWRLLTGTPLKPYPHLYQWRP